MSSPLDAAIVAAADALDERSVPKPALLILGGCGLPSWGTSDIPNAASGFQLEGTQPLAELPGVPEIWATGNLLFGSIATPSGRVSVWLIEDVSLDAPMAAQAQPFERGFMLWLAAHSGAKLCLHTSAGGSLPDSELQPGSLCLVRDYINLSGSSPLVGIGNSKLGPMFPDQTQLFSPALLNMARERSHAIGITIAETIVAAAAPVSMPTLAERNWFATAGAGAYVQGIATPFLAAAHAGLEVLAIVVLIGPASDGSDVQDLLRASEAVAPQLDDLLTNIAIPMATAAREAQEELV